MSDRFAIPVAVFLFNRPDRIRDLIGALRPSRPDRVLAVADGPRPGNAGDVLLCAEARAALDEIDWPCNVERNFSTQNLGCDQRLQTGLNWVFERVDRAILLEDDILPQPDLLPWMAFMLDRFGDDDGVAMMSGHNPLGYWGSPSETHLRSRRGSIWGWATTAKAWKQISRLDLAGEPGRAADELARLELDPLLAEHYAITLDSYRCGELSAWDRIWSLRSVLAGRSVLVSTHNRVRNQGIGPSATRTKFVDDFRALIPTPGPADHSQAADRNECQDSKFDRRTLLIELLAGCLNPSAASRLARLVQCGTSLPLPKTVRHHLMPFVCASETLAALEHLAGQGLSSPHFHRLMTAIRQSTETPSPTR